MNVELRRDVCRLFDVSIAAVTPNAMVSNILNIKGDTLMVEDKSYVLDNNVHVVAFGKAVIGMVRTVEDMLGNHIVDGVASIPYGMQDTLKSVGKWDCLPSAESKIQIIEGARNNIPDENSLKASNLIINLLKNCKGDDIVLVLISGGGSALLPSPIPPMTLDELSHVTQMFSRRGASIHQLNTLRKHLELLKGGGLARLASPAKVISLILSDVVDNDISFIASGPTAKDCSTPRECLDLIEEYSLSADIPASVLIVLKEELGSEDLQFIDGDVDEDVGESSARFDCGNAQNVVVGSNVVAVDSAAKCAESLGYGVHLLSLSVAGDAEERGKMFALVINYVCRTVAVQLGSDPLLIEIESKLLQFGLERTQLSDLLKAVLGFEQQRKPICIMAAGETTVHVTGKGIGGRNQHMVLSVALSLDEQPQDIVDAFSVVFLSGGTDGQDGPTDAAGALCDPCLAIRARQSGLDPLAFLRDHNSYNFFVEVDGERNLIKTGLTGTNVMDIQIILIAPSI